MRTSGLKPGQTAPIAGSCQKISPSGGKDPSRAVDKGEPRPSTSRPSSTYTLVNQALGRGNDSSPKNKPKTILLTKKGRLLPGVDIDNRAKLYELMDGFD